MRAVRGKGGVWGPPEARGRLLHGPGPAVCIGTLVVLLGVLGVDRPGPAGAGSEPPTQEERVAPVLTARSVAVRGGRLLSTEDVRRELRGRGEGAGLTPDEAQKALARLGRRLVAAGYLEAELRLSIPAGTETPVLDVDEGPAARWDTLLVQGPAAADSLAPPRPTGMFDAKRFERLLADWVDDWAEAGHPFAAASVESLAVDSGRVRIEVRLDPGGLERVQEIGFPGREGTRESFLRRWIRFRAGGLYRESEWDSRRRRLEQSGLFLRVGDPRLVRLNPGELRVLLPVDEGLHNRFEGAVGFAGASRTVTGFADCELGDLLGTGRSLGFRWERLDKDQSRLRLRYHEPLLGPLPVGGQVSVEQEVRDSTYTLSVWEGALEAWVGWDLSVRAGVEYRRAVLGPEPSELDRRLSSVFGGRWETIRPGRWRGGRLEGSYRSGRSQVRPPDGGPLQEFRLDRADLQGEHYWRSGAVLVLRAGVRAAALSRADRLPGSEALRVGGAGSIRGYREEQFSTRRYGVGQLELGAALPAAGGRAYLFGDGGRYRELTTARAGTAVGYGVGLASETASRRMTVDLGLARGASFREARLHVRLETRF